MEAQKIAFIKNGSFSHVNKQVFQHLKQVFPNTQVDEIDIGEIIKNFSITEKYDLLKQALASYGLKKVLFKGSARKYLLRTPGYFRLIEKKIKQQLKGKGYIFSIQMQSVYNANSGYCPHYIYTDHTHLTNLSYPAFSKKEMQPTEWLMEEERLYREATGVFTMSNHVRDSLLKHYHCRPEQVHCIYAGTNIPFEDRHYPVERYATKRILFVGIDWERKGGPHLFESFKLALKKHPDAKLVIVGCTPDIQHPQCEIVGRIPLEQVAKYYQEAAVFCMPTLREPFGIVYLEAMAHKLPVVATRIGALPDFVSDGETGYLVDCGDVNGLTDRLSRLLEHPNNAYSMGERAFVLVKDRYNWQRVACNIKEKTMHIFN
jgi:glycosyltransferase involved in cell wall biosynthesis